MIKEYAQYKDLAYEVAYQIGVDLRYNRLKLKYKIEGSIAPLEIHNDMGMRVYVSLNKEAREFAKYPICVTVFVNDCHINCRNQHEKDIGMCRINRGSTTDNQALVISAPLISTQLSNSIICNMNHKEIIEIKL